MTLLRPNRDPIVTYDPIMTLSWPYHDIRPYRDPIAA